ncbi:hypothetical protein CLV59_10477 [Chitinophaga dinghuensis]|uniref:Response regulatory domain-containing protein n=1 Tax=Chitinophaga dinghuensis TaxID=1539050 RepID=A0A327VZE2_9BACT|nr:hypothetical protein [Chitinophaga dinghuensis]RAJ81852.1 hypothetical protein CLV59_10477 [Chitinophaga dinghuensis]
MNIRIFLAANPSEFRHRLERDLSCCSGFELYCSGTGISDILPGISRKYDIILVDSQLFYVISGSVVGNAYELIAHVRRTSTIVPIVMLGDGAVLADRIRALAEGSDDFLDWEVATEELEYRINNWVKRARNQQIA